MKQLIEVIKLVADKYMDDISLILADHYLTLEYLTIRGGEKDVYKSMRIDEFEDKLKIYIYKDKIERIVTIAELEDIIKVLEKQSQVKEHTQEEVRYIRNKYSQDTRIELVKMYDLINPVPPHTKGTATYVDDIGTVHVNWDNGSTLGLTVGTDEFYILEGDNAQNSMK